jgi:hypothetical protein
MFESDLKRNGLSDILIQQPTLARTTYSAQIHCFLNRNKRNLSYNSHLMNIQNIYLLLMTFSALIIYIYHRTLRLKIPLSKSELTRKTFLFSHLFHPLFIKLIEHILILSLTSDFVLLCCI